MPTVISVENLAKTYRLGEISTGTFFRDFERWFARMRGKPDPYARIGETDHGNREGEELWALRDINFEVKQGEVLGIIGRNGAGKSTLLKILSRVTAPTSGQIKVRGRIASLLEVGTGFHPELTGRENIYLNGAILGMTREEVRRKFDEIVDFAGVEKFIDTPVKRYSSGMYVRLAFAVAAHLEPEILIVDEVLAVGDAEFQKKCLGKMGEVAQGGRTVLFVSHNMAAVSVLCMRCLFLDKGHIIHDGDVFKTISLYQTTVNANQQQTRDLSQAKRTGTGKAKFTFVEVKSTNNDTTFYTGQEVIFNINIQAYKKIVNFMVAIIVYDSSGNRLIDANTALTNSFFTLEASEKACITFTLEEVLLKPGVYSVSLWMGHPGIEQIDYIEHALTFSLNADPNKIKYSQSFPGIYQCRFHHHMYFQDTK